MKPFALPILALTMSGLLASLPLASRADDDAFSGGAFTYQGRLLQAGTPAVGFFDLRFELFQDAAGGNPRAAAVTNAAVEVAGGLFTTLLDMDSDAFSPPGSWLEIGVRPAGSQTEFVTLTPRQPLTPAPYAIHTMKAERLAGPLPVSQLPPNVARLDTDQTFTGAITFRGPLTLESPLGAADLDVRGTVQAESFNGDGAGLTNVIANALSARLAQRLWRVPIPFVTITNAGHDPDFNGKGAVAYPYRIGKYEVNNHQYAAFLNAVAAEDPHRLYNTNMSWSIHGGIERDGAPGEYVYTVKPGHAHKPVVWADFHNALRFCNWLHNGQPSGPQDSVSTEDGAYTMSPQAELANTIQRNPGARFWLPSDDEWYKAAYHQPWDQGGPDHGYWLYPTRGNSPPASELPPGEDNSANVCCATGGTATDVGAYAHSPSFYGTFDQAGNVQEWTEEIIFVTNRRLRGGSWVYNEFYAESEDFEFDTPDYPADAIGFRVAGAAEPP